MGSGSRRILLRKAWQLNVWALEFGGLGLGVLRGILGVLNPTTLRPEALNPVARLRPKHLEDSGWSDPILRDQPQRI